MTVLVVVLIGFLAVESAALVVVVGRWVAAVGRPPERVEVESRTTSAAVREVSDRMLDLCRRDVVPVDVMRQMLRQQAKSVEDVTRAVAAAVVNICSSLLLRLHTQHDLAKWPRIGNGAHRGRCHCRAGEYLPTHRT